METSSLFDVEVPTHVRNNGSMNMDRKLLISEDVKRMRSNNINKNKISSLLLRCIEVIMCSLLGLCTSGKRRKSSSRLVVVVDGMGEKRTQFVRTFYSKTRKKTDRVTNSDVAWRALPRHFILSQKGSSRFLSSLLLLPFDFPSHHHVLWGRNWRIHW